MRTLELMFITWLVLLQVAVAKEGDFCRETCGNLTIEYPFGIKEGCYLNQGQNGSFKVNCNTTDGLATLAAPGSSHNFIIKEIRLPNHVLLEASELMAVDCRNNSIYTRSKVFDFNVSITLPKPFMVSSRGNLFRAMGCDTTAYIKNNDETFRLRGQCPTPTLSSAGMTHGGLGQCQIAVPEGSSGYNYSVTNQFNYSVGACWMNCSYAFLADEQFEIDGMVLNGYADQQNKEVNTSVRFPLVGEWVIKDRKCIEGINNSATCGKNAWCNYTSSESGYYCLCNPDYKGNPYLNGAHGCQKKDGRFPTLAVALGVSAAICGLFLASFIYIVFTRKFLNTHGHKNMEAFLRSYGSLAPRRFRYSELKKMTESFKDKLGQGGYGGVFKGQLKDGRLVAVKVLNKTKGDDEEFINEVASISRTNHVNVVSLLGFCYEHSMRALIYEFMSNGSLEKFIYSDKSEKRRILECEALFKIALGIARGLEYLHRGCTIRILHFDIKPHNILLDDHFCPKISDFGLAKLCPEHESAVSMHDARGTMGYIAPEVYCRNIGVVSYKSDVYSYGMMVLEMVAGRKNIDVGVDNTSEIYFPQWIYNRADLQESLELLGIDNDADKEIARKMVLVGLWCIQTDPTNRPSMSKVLEMLEGSLENLHMPPKP